MSRVTFVLAATFGQIIQNTILRYTRGNRQIEFEFLGAWAALCIHFQMLYGRMIRLSTNFLLKNPTRRPAAVKLCRLLTVSCLETGDLFRRTHVGVGFYLAPLLFHNATQLTLHGFKRVVDDFFERFVSTVIHLLFIGHKLVPGRHRHVDTASVWIAFVMVVIGLLDRDIAAVNVITKSLQPFRII
jgi:hypothetical protein